MNIDDFCLRRRIGLLQLDVCNILYASKLRLQESENEDKSDH